MSNFQQIVSEEFRRLARKEVKASAVPMLKTIADLKQQVRDLRKELKELSALIAKQGVSVTDKEAASEEKAPAEKQIRLTAARIRACREKLGLSRKVFADLIGTTFVSVSNWENGKTVPRLSQKKKIVVIRDMGKRELAKLIAEQTGAAVQTEKAPAFEAAKAAEAPRTEAPEGESTAPQA